MPTAQSFADGRLALSTIAFGPNQRNALTFQITPRLSGTFRYATIDGFDFGRDRFDRSFDLTYQISDEGRFMPAFAVGLRDFGGTGVYSSEFLVATKSFGDRLRVSAGLGWGRLGERNGFRNPLAVASDYFETRPKAGAGGISTTGQLDFNNWFRGDVAVFGGLDWLATDRLRVVAEYSSDLYSLEVRRGGEAPQSPFNFGLTYSLTERVDVGLSYLYGTDIGVNLSYIINPGAPPGQGGIEPAPEPIRARDLVAAASWNLAPDSSGAAAPSAESVLVTMLATNGLRYAGMRRDGATVTLFIDNPTYDAGAQAIGRAARALANTQPAGVENFRIVPLAGGVPISVVNLRRSDLEELENSLDGSWQSYSRADIADGFGVAVPAVAPGFNYDIGGYLSPSLFDPDNPVRADVGVELGLSYAPARNLIFSGAVRQPVIGNLDTAVRVSDSILPHVRSDFARYDIESDLELNYLTAEYFYRPGSNLYGRLTAGYLEPMFAGVSAELLWKPVDRRIAVGAELNYAVQRDFDQGFGLQDYDVVTGQASAYLNAGEGYEFQLDAGRYLAGDWGATATMQRRFRNGVVVGAFFTLTDVSFDDFGEGSFDKGVIVTLPVSWLSGRSSRDDFTTVLRPVLRDGGARLDVRNRLYDLTRDYHQPELEDRWGRFWR